MLRKPVSIVLSVLWVFFIGLLAYQLVQVGQGNTWALFSLPGTVAFVIAGPLIWLINRASIRRYQAQIKTLSWSDQQRRTQRNGRLIVWAIVGFFAFTLALWLLSTLAA